MASKRVIAHFMHEYELAEVVPRLGAPVVTEGFAVGNIDESLIEQMEKKGIIFQEIGKRPVSTLISDKMTERVTAATADPALAPGFTSQPVQSDTYYLTLTGPLVPGWKKELENLGVAIRVALPDFCWVARIPGRKLAEVRSLLYVEDLSMRESDKSLPKRRELASFGSPAKVHSMIPYDVLLDKDASLAEFLAWLKDHNIAVSAAEGNKVRVFLLENDPNLTKISERTDSVIDIQPFLPPKLHNDHARVLLGVDPRPSLPPHAILTWHGETETIGIADTGLDDSHPDFAGRIAGLSALGRPGNTSDPHGHGTHVAGSVLGDGSASGGALRGVAPGAQLYFQSLLDRNGELGGLPFRLGTLFAEAYSAGVRIHNNSWGSAAMASYRANAREVDEYVHGQKDMLIVVSAGNEGTAADPAMGTRNSAPGFVDWLSVGSPATAKNALTVGASRSDRTSGGYANLTYGALWQDKFPAPPASADTISGDPESMAAFSSRGPCDDYRIKPDVVAPGTDIISCRSSQAGLGRYWGPDPLNPRYAYMGGTSMAAPLVTGFAALVRQYYVQRGHDPSAALLKATLINSTRCLTGPSSTAGCATLPNYHQGFGSVYLPTAVPNSDVKFDLDFRDAWQTGFSFSVTGQRQRFKFSMNPGGWLRITMAYTDPPGRALQNNLNLFCQLPDGTKKFGNMDLPHGLNRPDSTNNVETIRIEQAAAGDYLIQVVATNLLEPQDFALVVTGNLATLMTEV